MDGLSFDLEKEIKICRENDAAMVGVFGSVARGEDTTASDLDLMVKFSKRKSLLDTLARHYRYAGQTYSRLLRS